MGLGYGDCEKNDMRTNYGGRKMFHKATQKFITIT